MLNRLIDVRFSVAAFVSVEALVDSEAENTRISGTCSVRHCVWLGCGPLPFSGRLGLKPFPSALSFRVGQVLCDDGWANSARTGR